MPSPRILPAVEQDPDPHGVQKFFSKIASDYTDKRDRAKIGEIMKEYSSHPENVNAYLQARGALESSNIGPGARIAASENLDKIEKTLIEKGKALNAQAKALQPKETALDKKIATEAGKEYVKIGQELPKLQDDKKNLEHINALAKKSLSGPGGYAKAAFNSETAKEVENLSSAGLDPIIKIFNPVGQLPVKKLEWIRETFGIKASDRIDTIQGKVNARMRLIDQNIKRMQERQRLIKQHNGVVPQEVDAQFNKETELQNDVIADHAAFEEKVAKAGKDGMVHGLYDKNGEELDPIPVAEARELFEQGHITNEPK